MIQAGSGLRLEFDSRGRRTVGWNLFYSKYDKETWERKEMGQALLSSEPPGLIRLEVGCGENRSLPDMDKFIWKWGKEQV